MTLSRAIGALMGRALGEQLPDAALPHTCPSCERRFHALMPATMQSGGVCFRCWCAAESSRFAALARDGRTDEATPILEHIIAEFTSRAETAARHSLPRMVEQFQARVAELRSTLDRYRQPVGAVDDLIARVESSLRGGGSDA